MGKFHNEGCAFVELNFIEFPLLAVGHQAACQLAAARTPTVNKNGGPNHLRAWRKHIGLTQQEVANAVETTKSVISNLERGHLQLSEKWLRRLAPLLKTSPGYILDHDPALLDNDVFQIWQRIDIADRPQAMRVLRSFIRDAPGKSPVA